MFSASFFTYSVLLPQPRAPAARMSATMAPPALPPSCIGGGGGGGGGGGEFLRLLNAEEELKVLSDWTARARIYKLSDQAIVAERHEEALTELGSMFERAFGDSSLSGDAGAAAGGEGESAAEPSEQPLHGDPVAEAASFAAAAASEEAEEAEEAEVEAAREAAEVAAGESAAASPPTRRLTLGLFGPPARVEGDGDGGRGEGAEEEEEVEECPADGLGVHALASADISATGALVVRHLAVHPSETHDVDGSTAALRMLAGLRSLALAIDVRLEIEPLKRVNKGRYWLAAVAMLQCANGDEEACEVAEELGYGVEEREGERERREGGEEGGPWMP